MEGTRLLSALERMALLGLAAAWLAGCALPGERAHRAEWKREWNARVESNRELLAHPCGDFAFDPWADAFLAACSTEAREGDGECGMRARWVAERSRQCRDWKQWLLRNHNQQVRDDTRPEPETRAP